MNNRTDNNGEGGDPAVVAFTKTETLEDQAAAWVSRLDANKPSKATVAEFKQWVALSPEHFHVFEKHLSVFNDMNVLTRVVPPAYKAQSTVAQNKKPLSVFASLWQGGIGGYAIVKYGLAISMLFVLVISLQFNRNAPAFYQTAVGEQKTLQLADGTVVLLNTNTQLNVDYNRQRRAVYLIQGEAHFDVAHNPEVPFEVFAGKGKVRAIGTAFTVYLKSDDVEVVVTEGVVEILSTQAPPIPIAGNAVKSTLSSANNITAGNVATYDRHTAEHVMQVALGSDADKLSWHKGMLVFRNEPLEKVIAEVNRYTSIKIVIPSQEVRAIKVGGFFKVTDINSVFEALEKGFDIRAEVISEELVYLVRTKP